VEGGDALGDPRRMVEVERQLDDAVAEADARGALAGGREEDLGRGGVRVLLQEVVLDLPDVVEAKPVRELDLFERVLEQPVLVVLAPRAWELVLVEDPELHVSPPRVCGPSPARPAGVPPGRAATRSWNVANRAGRPPAARTRTARRRLRTSSSRAARPGQGRRRSSRRSNGSASPPPRYSTPIARAPGRKAESGSGSPARSMARRRSSTPDQRSRKAR